MSDRVGFYIDGFNLFFGLRTAFGHRYKWLDLGALCRQILRSDQRVELIRYCTAPVLGSTDQSRRQGVYWDALETVPGLTVHLGFHQKNKKKCTKCGFRNLRMEEKQSDSRIAALMVADAMADRVDTLVLIAGDSDHIPPVEVVKTECPAKDILVCWPPKRKSDQLNQAAGKYLAVSEAMLRKSLFPEQVPLPGGGTARCPNKWLPPSPPLSSPSHRNPLEPPSSPP